ncbi:MAG: hypothetical protein ACYCSI_11455 [Solirubrobacteraceae bacterium]
MPGSPTHCASVEVPVPADAAFVFMADGMKQTHWALGSWERRALGESLFVGNSLWDGKELYVKLVSHPELRVVDYFTGPDPERLRFSVSARVLPGEAIGADSGCSLITLLTWRTRETTEEGWDRTAHVWPTEAQLIKSRIEHELRNGELAGV